MNGYVFRKQHSSLIGAMDFRQWTRVRDWVLLASLLFISIAVMLAENASLVRTLRATSLEITGRVENSFSWVGRYFGALEENDILRSENIDLSSQLARSREAVIENKRLRRMVGFADTISYKVLPARIIEKDITQQKNSFILNVGALDGVEEGMGVLDERGILGKVIETSDHYALVMSYLNTGFRVPAKIQPSQAQGIVSWEGTHRDRLLLQHVIKTEQVAVDQLVVTSGFSSVFPPGYPIGWVKSVNAQPGKNQLVIDLLPATQIDFIEHAFVVLEKPGEERDSFQIPE